MGGIGRNVSLCVHVAVCVCDLPQALQVTVTKASHMKTTQKLTTPLSSMVYDIAPSVHQLSTVLQLSALETQFVVMQVSDRNDPLRVHWQGSSN